MCIVEVGQEPRRLSSWQRPDLSVIWACRRGRVPLAALGLAGHGGCGGSTCLLIWPIRLLCNRLASVTSFGSVLTYSLFFFLGRGEKFWMAGTLFHAVPSLLMSWRNL